jgi:DNA polymerase (family X)
MSASEPLPTGPVRQTDNEIIAKVLHETANLLEINGDAPFRVRSYRMGAEAIETLQQQAADLLAKGDNKLLEVPGIGKGMLTHIKEILQTGRLKTHSDLLEKYPPSILELLKVPGLGPKTVALIWSAYKVSDLDGLARLAREGKIRELPRMGEKAEQRILRSIETYRDIAGRSSRK